MRDRVPREEIEKWLEKVKEEMKNIKGKPDFIRNIQAYVDDCEHWLKEGDYVLAFESIIWSWAWVEIGKEMGLIKVSSLE